MGRTAQHQPADPNQVLVRNIRALVEVQKSYQRERTFQERLADAITGFAGSMKSVYLHAVLFGGWLLINSGVLPIVPAFDPFPFVMLAMFASVEAIFLSTFVMVSQNRNAELDKRRDALDLQVNLLAEHEITKLIAVLDEIAKHLGVPRFEQETAPLKEDVAPEKVLRAIADVEGDTQKPRPSPADRR